MTLRLALRGLRRTPRRGALAGAALAFAVAALVVAFALIEGVLARMVRGAAASLSGDALVLPAGAERPLAGADRLRESIRDLPGVTGAAVRLRVPALLSAGERRSAGEVLGIDPAHEEEVTDAGLLLAAGEWLPGDGGALLLGAGLADALGAAPGARVAVSLRAADGLPAVLSLPVAGVVATRDPGRDARIVVTGLAGLRRALAAPGAASEIGVSLADPAGAPAAARRIAASLGAGPGLVVAPWQRRLPALAAAVAFARASSWWLAALLQGAAGLVVLAVLLLSFHERRREHALCLALGASPRTLAGAILAEAVLLGAAAAAVGAAAGGAAALALSGKGLRLAFLTGPVGYAGGVIEPVLRAAPAWWQVGRAAGSALAAATLAGWLAARRLHGVSPLAVMADEELR